MQLRNGSCGRGGCCDVMLLVIVIVFFQDNDGIGGFCLSRGLGDVYKKQICLGVVNRFSSRMGGGGMHNIQSITQRNHNLSLIQI